MHPNCYKKIQENSEFAKQSMSNSFFCKFKSLSEFHCHCTYFSPESNGYIETRFNYKGNDLINWHKNRTIVPIQIPDSRESEITTTFKNFLNHCTNEKNNLLACDYLSQIQNQMDCFCQDENFKLRSRFYMFLFEEVFSDQDIFSSQNDINNSKFIPPPQ